MERHVSMNIYYVYAYLREDGTPYYIGKGVHKRAWKQHRKNGMYVWTPKDKSRIVILKEHLTNQQAKELEIELIVKYGRKDIGTGILRNMTDGGEGLHNPSQEIRDKKSKSMIGKNTNPKSLLHRKKISESMISVNREKMLNGTHHLLNDIKCPHCEKIGQMTAMKRWHFDNCKNNI